MTQIRTNTSKPAMDIQIIRKCIEDAKDLVGSVMQEIHAKRKAANEIAP